MSSVCTRKDPLWLRPQWEKKKADTAKRLARAVEVLKQEQREITLTSIRETILHLFNQRTALATIQQSEIYRQHRSGIERCTFQDTALERLYREALPQVRQSLTAKVARLRREKKDTLIAKLIAFEQAALRHKEVEITLQQEIIRLNHCDRSGEVRRELVTREVGPPIDHVT